MWRVVAALALLSAGTGRAPGAGPPVPGADTTIATPARATVGDTITLSVGFTLPRDATPLADAPTTRDSLPDGVRLRDVGALRRAGGGTDGTAWTARVVIAFYRPGVHDTPAFAVAYRRAGVEGTDTAVSGTARITIARVLPDTSSGMKDIKPLADLPGETSNAWWIALVAALVLGAAAAVAIRARRRAGARVVVAAAPPPPPSAYEEARDRLLALEREGWARRDVARVYDEATAAVRRYLEEAHGVRAMRRTTHELARALPAALAADGRGGKLRALLGDADLVKFARLRPAAADAEAFAARALALLEGWHAATAPVEAAASSAAPEEAGALR